MNLRPVLFAAALAFPATPAIAAGDAAEGERLATQWCSGCHAVGEAGSDIAPPLASIAAQSDRDGDYLFLWLTDPHPPMPQLDLSRREIGDIIAYLQRLAPGRAVR